jgi:hypothetical protein
LRQFEIAIRNHHQCRAFSGYRATAHNTLDDEEMFLHGHMRRCESEMSIDGEKIMHFCKMWREQWRVCERGGVNRRRRGGGRAILSAGLMGQKRYPLFCNMEKAQVGTKRAGGEKALGENTKAARAPCVNEPLF